MLKRVFIFTVLLTGLVTILHGQTLVLSPTTFPDAIYGSSYPNQPITATGGMAPYTFFVSAGSLPANMSLSPDGTLSGTPAAAGTYNFTVTAQDATPDPGTNTGTQNYTLVVDPAVLTITAGNASMTYGGSVPALGVSYSGFVNGDNASSLTSPATASTTATSASPAGPYSITASGAASPNYSFAYQSGTLTIGKAALTATADNKAMPLGGPLPTFTVSYSGFVNGDGAASLTTQPTATTTATAASPAGTYAITVGGGVSSNYNFTYVNGTLAVAQAVLTITANPANSVYGAPLVAPGALTVTYSGFVNGDGPSSMTKAPTVANSATPGADVGAYTLTPSGAVNPNYVIQYVNGTYTINPAPLTVTGNNASMTYGGTVPALSVSYTGFVNGDGASSVTTAPTVTTTATSASPVGTYPITPSGAAASNYTISYQAGTLTVAKATLTVTADNKSMPLGGPLPPFTVSYSGFVNGDNASSLSTAPTATTTATAASPAGAYPITPKGGAAANYTFSYVNGTLAVAQAVLTITANPASSVYGAPLVAPGALTVTYSGFVNGDGPSSMTTPPTVTNSATPGAAAGTYNLTPSGAVNPNYVIEYVKGTYTINPAPLTITGNNASMTYGGTVPALGVSYSGFVNGDGTSKVTTPPTVTTTATSASPAGTYPVTASGAAATNYVISYQTGTLTIGKATLTVTADSKAMPLGGPLPAFTVSYSGFVNGDNASSLTTAPTATTTATAASPSGIYPIVPKGGVSANYNFNYVNGTLAVAQAVLTITANPASSVYGSPLVAPGTLTVSYSGFANGDGPSSLTALPHVTNTAFAGAPAGSYTLTPSGAVSANYLIQYVNGAYTISPAPLTITAANQTMTYGGTVPPLSASYSGFVNGDKVSSLSPPAITTTATSSSPAGAYPITAAGAVDPNYTITYVAGTMTINPASLSVTANPQTKKFGQPDPTFTYTSSGYLNGDDSAGVFTGSLSRAAGENVGTYPITLGTLSAGGNYTVHFTGNTFKITAASQQITWNQSLIVGCNGTTQVVLNAIASSGLPITYSVSDKSIATISGDTLTLLEPGNAIVTATQAGNSNYTAATPVKDTVSYQATSLIAQHWNDAIFFDNSSDDYVSWQWYKNDSLIPGATDPYYTETPSLNGQYFVIATNKDSQQVQSCTVTITASSPIPGGIKVQPNPVGKGQQVTVTSNYPSAALQNAILQVVDLSGKVLTQIANVQPATQVTMPSQNGLYIINLILSSGAKASVNVLVD